MDTTYRTRMLSRVAPSHTFLNLLNIGLYFELDGPQHKMEIFAKINSIPMTTAGQPQNLLPIMSS